MKRRTQIITIVTVCVVALGAVAAIAGPPIYRDFRSGDVRHSQADISKAQRLLGYVATHDINEGVLKAMPWYVRFLKHTTRR